MDQVQAGPHIKKRTEERILDQVACPLMHGQDTIYSMGGDEKKWIIIFNAVYEGHLFLTLGFASVGTVIYAEVVMFDTS